MIRRGFLLLALGWAVLLAAFLVIRVSEVPGRLRAAALSTADRATLASGDPAWHRFLGQVRAATGGAPVIIMVSGGRGREEFLSYRAAFELYPAPVWVMGTGMTLPPATGTVPLDPDTAAWVLEHHPACIGRWRDGDMGHPELSRIVTVTERHLRVERIPLPNGAHDTPDPILWRWCAALALLSCAAGFAVRFAVRDKRPSPSGWDRAGQVMVVAAFALAVVQAAAPQTAWANWDAWMNWDIKVKAILHEGWLPRRYLTEPGYLFSHQEYPLGWAWVQAGLAWCAGAWDDRLLRLLSPVWCLAMAPLVAALAGELGVVRGRWLIAGLVTLLPLAVDHAANGYVDWPLAVVTTGAQVALLRVRRGATSGRVAGAWAGAAGWLKQEGGVVGGACILVLGWSAWKRRDMRREWLNAALVWVVMMAMPLGQRLVFPLDAPEFQPLSVALMAAAPHRLAAVGHALVKETVGSGRVHERWVGHLVNSWLLFWYIALPAIVVGWRRIVAPGRKEVAMVVAVQVFMSLAAYVSSNWEIETFLGTSLDRLLLQMVPGIAVLAAVAGPLTPVITVRPKDRLA